MYPIQDSIDIRFNGNPKSIKPTNAGINAIKKGIPKIIEYLIFI